MLIGVVALITFYARGFGDKMETTWPVLTILTFLPMIGVVFLMLIRGDEEIVIRNARNVALWVSGFTFIMSLFVSGGISTRTSQVISLKTAANGLPVTGSVIIWASMVYRCHSWC